MIWLLIVVNNNDEFVALCFELQGDPAKFKAEFIYEQGIVRGAYHVEVEKERENPLDTID